jgi:hypothetical protein
LDTPATDATGTDAHGPGTHGSDAPPSDISESGASGVVVLEPATPAVMPAASGPRVPRNGLSRRPTSGAGAGGAEEREAERGLRGLVGSGSSQVSVGAAMRARDAARPSDEQLADAEANLTIVRRNWQPREDLPRR